MSTQPSFKDMVEANRRAGRLASPAPRSKNGSAAVQAGVRLLPDEMAQARGLALGEGRSTGSFIRRVYLLGLQAYLAEHGAAVTVQQ